MLARYPNATATAFRPAPAARSRVASLVGGLKVGSLKNVLVAAPLVLLLGCGEAEKTAEAPPPPDSDAVERPQLPKKKAARPSAPEREPEAVEVGEPAPPAGAPPDAEPDVLSEAPSPKDVDDAKPARGLDVAKPEPPTAGAPPPAPGAAGEDSAWDVVPVFYGTDRARIEGAPRLDYGDGRGRRLELGRALVTVPKSHTVPQIERPWTMRIPLVGIEIKESEDPKEHFTMKEVTALSREEFLALVGERIASSARYKKQALVFVHGFNTTFDFAIYRTAQISYDLKFDGAAFAYSWPSGGGVLNYTYDRESSGQAQPYLRDFINLVLKDTGAEAVSLVAHSMGNQPALQVLKDLRASRPEGVIFNQIILAAPDVDRDNFENIAREIQGLAKGITLYAAKNDKALAISRNVNGGVPRAGDVPLTGPLVLDGVDTIDVTSVSTDSLGLNHSGYAENNDLLQDVRILIETGMRPPEKRVPSTRSVQSPTGTYWEFVAPAP